ncbi:hypothetical protein DIPPA_03264 [Diplonema papillatum]|nr:hypothetical protein DIPPA_03264 [Diplonema papillatum]
MTKHQRCHTAELTVPSKAELAKLFEDALKENYAEVQCTVGPCPDLRKHGLVCEGLGGKVEYADCGTVLKSMFNPDKQLDVFTVPATGETFGRKDAFVIGSGAGSTDEFVVNSEWCGNLVMKDGVVQENGSYASFVTDMSVLPEARAVRKCNKRGEFGTIGNVLFTDGTPGDVIIAKARVRRVDKNWSEDPHDQEFIRILRTAINKQWPDAKDHVLIGGVMVVVKGKTLTHVMPPYFPPPGSKPGKSWPDMNGWSERYFVSNKQLIGCTTFLNHQGAGLPDDLKWRPDHTHFFTQDESECGHYHHDLDPDVIEYVAYLVPAAKAHKVELVSASKL